MTNTPMFIRYPPPTVIPTLEQVLISGNFANGGSGMITLFYY